MSSDSEDGLEDVHQESGPEVEADHEVDEEDDQEDQNEDEPELDPQEPDLDEIVEVESESDDFDDDWGLDSDDEGGQADGSYSYMDDVNRRAGHIAVPYRDGAIVWGGYNEVPPYLQGHEYYLPSEIWRYSYLEDNWKKLQSTGDVPNRCSGAGACVVEDTLLVVAGFHQIINGDVSVEDELLMGDIYYDNMRIEISNRLWSLCLRKLVWTKLEPAGVPPLFCDKTTMWSYEGKAYVFAGFGPPPENVHSTVSHLFQYTEDGSSNSTRGWSNQLLYFDRESNSWTWPTCTGTPPSPRACPSSVIVGDKVYIFGGRHDELRLNDLHSLDLRTHTWTNLLLPSDCPPVGRSWQSVTPLFTGKPAGGLLLYGGFDNDQKALGDCWKLDLDLEHLEWKRMCHLEQGPRLWHAAAAVNSFTTMIIGGLINNILAPSHINKLHAPKVLVLKVGPKSLLASALEYISEHKETYKNLLSEIPFNLRSILETRTNGG